MGDVTKQWRLWAKAVQYPDLVDVNRVEGSYRDLSAKTVHFLDWLKSLSANNSLLAACVSKEEYEAASASTEQNASASDATTDADANINVEAIEESFDELAEELRQIQRENLKLRKRVQRLKDILERTELPEDKEFDQEAHIKRAEQMDLELLEKAEEISKMKKPGRRVYSLRGEIDTIAETEAMVLREAASATSGNLVMGTAAGQISIEHAHARGEQELQRLHEAKTKLLELSFDARMANARADGELKFRRKWVSGYTFSAGSSEAQKRIQRGGYEDDDQEHPLPRQLGQPNLKQIKEMTEEAREEIEQLKQKLFELMELRPTLVSKSASATWLQKQNARIRSCIASQEFVLKVIQEQGDRYKAFQRGQERLLEHMKVQVSSVDACVHFAELSKRNCDSSREYLLHVMGDAHEWQEVKNDPQKWSFRERGRDSLAYSLTQAISSVAPAAVPESATAASQSQLRRSSQSLSPIRSPDGRHASHSQSPVRRSMDTSMKSMMPTLSALSPTRTPFKDTNMNIDTNASTDLRSSHGTAPTPSMSLRISQESGLPSVAKSGASYAATGSQRMELGRVVTFADAQATVQAVNARKLEAFGEVSVKAGDVTKQVAASVRICEDLRRASGFVKLPKSLKLDDDSPSTSTSKSSTANTTSSNVSRKPSVASGGALAPAANTRSTSLKLWESLNDPTTSADSNRQHSKPSSPITVRTDELHVEVATVVLREALAKAMKENAALQRDFRHRAKALLADVTEKTTSVKELKEGNRFQASPRSGGATSPRGALSPRGRGKDQAPDKLGDSSDGHGPRERRLFPLFSACDKDDEALAALRRELIR